VELEKQETLGRVGPAGVGETGKYLPQTPPNLFHSMHIHDCKMVKW